MQERCHSPIPRIICLTVPAVFMIIAAVRYWPAPELAFRTDDSPVAWLSSAQLWAIAILVLRLWHESTLPRSLCSWLSLAMMGMAFDEQFMLHEHWKYSCMNWLTACQLEVVREMPMILVGGLGGLTALWLHHQLPERRSRLMLWLSVLIGIFALYLRFTQRPIVMLPYKAAVLVISEALFAATLLGLKRQSVRENQVHSP